MGWRHATSWLETESEVLGEIHGGNGWLVKMHLENIMDEAISHGVEDKNLIKITSGNVSSLI